MTTYRLRLDTTTNWAVGTTAAITSLALGSGGVPHYAFALTFALDFLFLWMEARRYIVYEMVRLRVRLLEQGFYLDVLGAGGVADWERELAQSLSTPTSPISYVQAFAVRLRRSYLWLFFLVYLVWVGKVELTGTLPEAARVAGVPGGVVLALGLVPLVALVGVALTHRAREEG